MYSMNRVAAILYIVFISLALSSCGVGKHAPVTSVKDSVVVHVRDSVIFRDSVILVPLPVESSTDRLPDTDTSTLKTSLAESEAWVSSGKLHHTLRNRRDSVRIPVKLPEHFHSVEAVKQQAEVIHHTVTVEKELSWWQRFRMDMGTLAIVAMLIVLAVWAVKRFLLKI